MSRGRRGQPAGAPAPPRGRPHILAPPRRPPPPLRAHPPTLFDFDVARDAVPVDQMDTLDRWALHQTATLVRECTVAYENYEFHRVYQLCNHFCSVTLSATYHDVLKDRLYTLATNAPLRRSSQTAIYHIFEALAKLL